MSKNYKWVDWVGIESCPICNDDLRVLTAQGKVDDEQYFLEGDKVECVNGCDIVMWIDTDLDSAWVSWIDDEPTKEEE